jgi:hypothetical protein
MFSQEIKPVFVNWCRWALNAETRHGSICFILSVPRVAYAESGNK